MVTFEENNGFEKGKCIIIRGAANEAEGVASEYKYLTEQFGERDKGWHLRMQSVVQGEGGKLYDKMEIILASGEPKTIYFDVTEFYGKF